MTQNTIPSLECAFLSDIGMKRKQNQDSGLVRPDLGLFMVADGMGGHLGGEIASKLCVERVEEFVLQNASSQLSDSELLEQGLMTANQAIYEQSQKNPELNGMGTTATLLRVRGNQATVFQVGDSRAYFWNKAGIWQLTRDHSLVQEKLRAGLITRSQVKSDQLKNVITRSVGYEPSVKGDTFQFPVQPGDGFLLCSDGLSGPVDDSTLFDILDESARSGLSLSESAKRMVDSANSRGGDDNVTVVLVRVNF